MRNTMLSVLMCATALSATARGQAPPPPPPQSAEGDEARPPGPPPDSSIPAPPHALPAPPIAEQPAPPPQAEAPAGVENGQWVYTGQYGWVWMPFDQEHTYVSPDGSVAYSYVYYPSGGWRWVAAPWIFGVGPRPFWGAVGPWRFAWYAHPWFRVGPGWWGHHGGWGYRGPGWRGGFGFHGGGRGPAPRGHR